MKKIIKNTTNSEIVVFGVHIPPLSESDISTNFWQKLASDLYVKELISNRTVIINNGSIDLDIDEALNYVSTSPSLSTRDQIFQSESIVIYTGQQVSVFEEMEINEGGEIVVNGTLFVLE